MEKHKPIKSILQIVVIIIVVRLLVNVIFGMPFEDFRREIIDPSFIGRYHIDDFVVIAVVLAYFFFLIYGRRRKK